MDVTEEKAEEPDLEAISNHSKGPEDKINVEAPAVASHETSHNSGA